MKSDGQSSSLSLQVIITAGTGILTAFVAAMAAIYGAQTVGRSQIEAMVKAAEENLKSTTLTVESNLQVAKIARETNIDNVEKSAKKNLDAIMVSAKLQRDQAVAFERERQQAEILSAAKVITADILSRISALKIQPLSGDDTIPTGIAADFESVGALSYLIKSFLSEIRVILGSPTPDYIFQSSSKLPMDCTAAISLYYSRIAIEKNRLTTYQSDENMEKMIDNISKSTDSNYTKGAKLTEAELKTAKDIYQLRKKMLDVVSRAIAQKKISELLYCESLGYAAIASLQHLVFHDNIKARQYDNLSKSSKAKAIDIEKKGLDSAKQFSDMIKQWDKVGRDRYQKNLDNYFNQFLQE